MRGMSSDAANGAGGTGGVGEPPFDRDLFDLLVCPESRAPLKYVGGRLVSTDAGGRRAYRVDQGIPVMLVEESQVLSESEWKTAMAAAGPVGAGVVAVQARHGP
jgi:uncharacterized protein YbaR (Trm112 family)